jgi:ABC-2 type transport system permease protein
VAESDARAEPTGGRLAEPVHAYLLLASMWTRAAFQYPASLLMLTVAQAAVTALDIVAILVLFAHTQALAGFSLAEVLFLYGTTGTSIAIADLLLGTLDRLGTYVRTGGFDVMLIRPVSTLIQLAADKFSPRRLGRLAQAVGALAVSLPALDVSWTPLRVALVPVMIVSGVVIFGAIWVLGAAFQFLAVDSAEAVNAFTYGGDYLNQYPLSIYGRDVMRVLTWGIPLAFVNWQPSLYVLSEPDPLGLPTAFRFASPVVAAGWALVAGLAWQAGVRRYRSTGS